MTGTLACSSALRIESLGHGWVAFAPSSGETLLLNDECAALVEELQEGPGTLDEICCRLAADLEMDAEELRQRIAPALQQLIDIGLITDTHGLTP